ncbi:VanZ family protein [Blautia wexlerae]|uniref:VanZ family protein n=1 Tax=Blautia wexlerae TaxID=418240 RepID=UPI003B5067AB
MVNNIWLFIPLGTGLYKIIRKKWILLIPVLFSVMIESIQYFTGLGIADSQNSVRDIWR